MPNASDVVFDTLERWGVRVVFGLPGDGINGLMEALRTRQDRIRFVLVRHEESAAFAACAYAKWTGRLGACIATTGPGGLHLTNGLYDAKMDSQPVVAITGTTYSDLQGSKYQQDVDLAALFADATAYSAQVNSAEHARLVTDLACRHALARRMPAHVSVPIDVQEEECEGETSKRRQLEQTSADAPRPLSVPPLDELRRAAAVLSEAERPVILAGQGARGGRVALAALAERLQAPVVKALLGKDVMPDDHPLVLGGTGLLGTAPATKALEQADVLLMVGTSFPYTDFLPKPGTVRAVQIDADPTRIGLRHPVDVGLVGDAALALDALVRLVPPRGANDWVVGLQGEMREWNALLEDRAARAATPMKPQMLAWELGRRLRDDAILCGDSGTNTTWVARYVPIRGDQRFSCSGTLASMASGLPYAIAAQVAYPERQVVAFMGDGALMMLAGELSAIAQHRLPIKIVVVQNRTLGMIKWEQMVFLGNPSFGVELPETDFAKVAEGMGVKGLRAESPEELGPALDDLLAHDGPALLDAVVDPFEPPHPPQVKLQQAIHMAEALARGEPNRTRIGLTLFRDKVQDLTKPATRHEERARSRR